MWPKKFDHCAIYLLIAGTYTPFLLVAGFSVSARVDDCYLEPGIAGDLVQTDHRAPIQNFISGDLSGDGLAVAGGGLMKWQLSSRRSVTLLAVGGVVYSLGVIFYVCKRIPYNHAIWHGFVLGGSVCHFLAIYLYIGQA